jgi:tryptophan-rich sensory protein
MHRKFTIIIKKMSTQAEPLDPKPTLGSGPVNFKWYLTLKRSKLNPPQWVFPIVWTILYIMIAASGFIYLNKTGLTYSHGLLCSCLQIFLNVIWTPLFFWKKLITLALIDLILLWITVAVTIYLFYQQS